MNFTVGHGSVGVGQDNKPIFLRFDTPGQRILRRIESVTISGDTVVETSPVPLNYGKLQDTAVAWATVPYEGKQATFVPSEDKTGIAKASFDMGERSVELRNGPPAD